MWLGPRWPQATGLTSVFANRKRWAASWGLGCLGDACGGPASTPRLLLEQLGRCAGSARGRAGPPSRGTAEGLRPDSAKATTLTQQDGAPCGAAPSPCSGHACVTASGRGPQPTPGVPGHWFIDGRGVSAPPPCPAGHPGGPWAGAAGSSSSRNRRRRCRCGWRSATGDCAPVVPSSPSSRRAERSPPSARRRPAPRATWLLPPAQVLLSAYGVVTFRCGRAGCGFVSHFRARDSHFSPLESPVLQFWKILGRSLFECCLFPVRFCLPAETLRSQDVPPGPPRLRPALGHPVPLSGLHVGRSQVSLLSRCFSPRPGLRTTQPHGILGTLVHPDVAFSISGTKLLVLILLFRDPCKISFFIFFSFWYCPVFSSRLVLLLNFVFKPLILSLSQSSIISSFFSMLTQV